MGKTVGKWWGAVVLAVSLFMTDQSAWGADESGKYALRGIGAQTCAQFTEAVSANETAARNTLEAWATGYLSAMNRAQPGVYDLAPIYLPGALSAIMVENCARNAERYVEQVFMAVLGQLAPLAVPAESPLLEAVHDGRRVVLRRETLRAIQAALTEAGHDVGTPDGAYGARTRTALLDYQKGASLPETGLPDIATTLRLLIESR